MITELSERVSLTSLVKCGIIRPKLLMTLLDFSPSFCPCLLWLNHYCTYPHMYHLLFPESYNVHADLRIMGFFRLISISQMILELATWIFCI